LSFSARGHQNAANARHVMRCGNRASHESDGVAGIKRAAEKQQAIVGGPYLTTAAGSQATSS
jgi:hypothetical protein